MARIRIEDLSKDYITANKTLVEAVKHADLTVENGGEVVVIIGPSGSGKSTLLRSVNKLENPTGGKIFIDEDEVTDPPHVDLRKIREEVGMVFQSFNLFPPHLSVMQNITLAPVKVRKMSQKKKQKRKLGTY